MKLAELCDIASNYIGQIEIGRRFPSLKLIDKISQALNVEPYRFFIDESGTNHTELDEAIALLAKLPDPVRLNAINRISAPVG
jgi:transcriptional regulator with XRE-family HTH domain